VIGGLRLAFTMFSTGSAHREPTSKRTARWAVLLSPVVGALAAVVAAALMIVARRAYGGPIVYIKRVHVEYLEAPILAAALAIVLMLLLTRGRLLQSLARTVDRLTSPTTLEALGPVGAIAFVCLLLLDVLALASSVLAHHGTQSLLFSVVSGRLAIVWACTPGVGPQPATVAWTIVGMAAAGAYGRFDSDVGSNSGAVRGVVALLVALLAAWCFRRHIVRRLGVVSGSSIGALCELAATVSLLITAVGKA
jgi:adenosylcobinamide-GDP ribazoletransferase